jgi:hypothetical protein
LTDSPSPLLLVHDSAASRLDYGRRVGRLRWRRALGGCEEAAPRPEEPAAAVFEGRSAAVILRDDLAIPFPVEDPVRLFSGRVVPARSAAVLKGLRGRTLREREAAGFELEDGTRAPSRIPAAGFDLRFLRPREGETMAAFSNRVFECAEGAPREGAFRSLVAEEDPEEDRSELRRFIPGPARHICDVSQLGPDPGEALERLAREGRVFDAFVFSGVLENLEDPVCLLTLARKAAHPDAALVAKVPNVGYLSIARDLLLGRMDVTPAGPTDVRRLRWFDRRFLLEAVTEAGWRVERVEDLPGDPPDAEPFFAHFKDWPNLDRASLLTRAWVAVAKSGECEGQSAKF